MPPRTYKGKRPARSSAAFNTERFKNVASAQRFESRFVSRTVIFERQVVQSALTGTRFLHWLHVNGCMILMNLINECFEDWVREFYYNMFDVSNGDFKTYVRGKMLHVDANKIATILHLRRPTPADRSYPIPDVGNMDIQANEVATVLCGAPTVWENLPFSISGLTTDYRLLNTFVCHNIERRSHQSDLLYDQAFLLYCLGTGNSVDIPQTIFDSMLRVYHEPRKLTLPFGAVICKMIIEAGCQAYLHEMPVSRRQKIDGRTQAMSDTHVRRHPQRVQALVEDDDAETASTNDRLLELENAVYDQSVQIEQLEARMAAGFSGIGNQLTQMTEMFTQLRHK